MRKLEIVIGIIFIVLLLWALISWGEVLMFNMNPEHIYSSWNVFKIIVGR